MPAKPKVGFAVVGLGLIAQGAILPAFSRSKRAKLVAVVSRDKKQALTFAHKYKAKAGYSSTEYAVCLANPDVTAVYIATPPGEHEGLAVQAAAAGKHVLCEKPLAATVEQAARMVAACRKQGVLLMTAYRKHFEPSTVYLKKLIRAGTFGRIDVIHTAFSENYVAGKSPAWLLDKSLAGGGPLMDLGVYCVNTARWLAGEDPVSVFAESWRHDHARFQHVEEGIAFRMTFPTGLVVQASSTYGSVLSSFLSIQGTKGWAMLAPAFPFDQPRRLVGNANGRPVERRFRVTDEFALELDAFSRVVQTGGTLEPDGAQGLRDLQIIGAIYESARMQRTVTVRYKQ